MMAGLSNTFSPSSLSLSIHPPHVPLHLCTFVISYRSPAVSASASEPSPPRTWRPRSPAPRTGSKLFKVGGRQYGKCNSRLCVFWPSVHIHIHTHIFCFNPPKASHTNTRTHITLFLYIREYFCQVGKRHKLGSDARLVSASECESLWRKEKQKHNFSFLFVCFTFLFFIFWRNQPDKSAANPETWSP